MISSVRQAYNNSFTKEKYQEFLADLDAAHPGAIEFRVAETPLFISRAFSQKMLSACESIIDLIIDPEFVRQTERSIPPAERVPGSLGRCQMIAFDFGICQNSEGELEPQLIEMQGFPTLYGFQPLLAEYYKKHFSIPANFSPYPGNLDAEQYAALLRNIILGNHQPEEVILLEIHPHQQKTRIDFYCTSAMLGIPVVCITELVRQGNKLFYSRNGELKPVKRIYNRVIFDELNAHPEIKKQSVDITAELDVEWIPHPDWFYRISKYTLPFLHHPYVPRTFFLNELKQVPDDLENYVLKPLFSFAGQGVIIDVTAEDITGIPDPENWILQQKVQYAAVVETPDTPAKAEIRIMYLWDETKKRPQPAINLARLSKGKMIGVRYNKDMDWVGGSICFFAP